MDYKLLVNTAVLAGETMLKNGAETYRVEDTIRHILRTANVETAETIVLLTGIVVTLDDPDIDTITTMRRVKGHGTNLNRIDQVNRISRQYCSGEISLEQAYSDLKAIGEKQYKSLLYNVATVCVCAGFVPLFGGKIPEVLCAALEGMVLALIITAGKHLRINSFILDVLSSAGVAVIAVLLGHLPVGKINMDVVIISSIMPLVPGVAITNAVRDTLQGDYLSGMARILEAFLKAAAIALGVGVGLALMEGLI